MFWEDKDNKKPYQVSDDVIDLTYNIKCKSLPIDHASKLSSEILSILDWMKDEEHAGIHLIHGAESGNGWMRPENPETQLLHLSRRARMTLRLPKDKIDAAQSLTGKSLDIDGHSLEIGPGSIKLFSTLPTQFARYIVIPDAIAFEDEEAFLTYAATEIRQTDIKVRKMLCGRAHSMQVGGGGQLQTRSLMLADLDPDEAVKLQQTGIGQHKMMGCGLFMPHKGIAPVHETNEDASK
ncbi:MAG: type I-MYXAN CRISPR-associated protein Cas6/Cmx6 [Gammaproteobacteria bacterium]